jgi:AAA+ superfamily predicted ATPase
MGKILELNARRLGRKSKPMSEREMTRKVIKFRKRKSADNSERAETRKLDQATAAALFFGCF